jgi:hypothetical protein
MYCAPSHTSNAEMQFAWEFVAAHSLRSPSLPKSRKGARFGKRPLQLRKHRLKPVLPKPNTGEPRRST